MPSFRASSITLLIRHDDGQTIELPGFVLTGYQIDRWPQQGNLVEVKLSGFLDALYYQQAAAAFADLPGLPSPARELPEEGEWRRDRHNQREQKDE